MISIRQINASIPLVVALNVMHYTPTIYEKTPDKHEPQVPPSALPTEPQNEEWPKLKTAMIGGIMIWASLGFAFVGVSILIRDLKLALSFPWSKILLVGFICIGMALFWPLIISICIFFAKRSSNKN